MTDSLLNRRQQSIHGPFILDMLDMYGVDTAHSSTRDEFRPAFLILPFRSIINNHLKITNDTRQSVAQSHAYIHPVPNPRLSRAHTRRNP